MPDEVKLMWVGAGLDPDSCLCAPCPHRHTCEWVWDLYNHGDCCLADK